MALMHRLAVTLIGGLAISCCYGQSSHPNELVCNGQVKFSDSVIIDKLVLRVEGDAIEIRGEPGSVYTFDGVMYKVCSESRDEVEFEYTATGLCGNGKVSRFGDLQKVTGDMTIERFDMGNPFWGRYKCEKASRSLDGRRSR